MELRHLRYFVAVAELENVSRAALRLHISQPALSRQLRDLEDELGFPLLQRSAKSVRLTETGRVFLDEARAVLQRAAEAVSTARAAALGSREEIHVGYAPTLTARLLPPALRFFQSSMPKACVKLHDLTTEEMLSGLRQAKLNLAVSVRPARNALRGLVYRQLLREPLRLAVAPAHPLAARKTVPLEEILHYPFIAYNRADYPDYHEMISEVFAHRPPHVSEEHDGVSSLISAIEVGSGVSIVPQSMNCISGVRLKLLPISPNPASLSVGLILRKEEANATVHSFVDAIEKSAAKLNSD